MNELIFHWLNQLAVLSPFGDRLIIFAADYLGYILILGAIIYFIFRGRRAALFVSASSFLAWLLAEVIKHFYFSPRPFLVLDNVRLLIQHGGNDSWPSGHATFFMALATALYLFNKKLGNLYLLGAVIISLARVVAGIHWPLDVLAGWVLAWLVVTGLKGWLPATRL